MLCKTLSKGYAYFAMGFAAFLEFLNLRVRCRHDRATARPVELRRRYARKGGRETSSP